MPHYSFGKNDLFTNVIQTYPEVNIYIYGEKKYLQNQDRSKINSNNPSGFVNLYELNVDRSSDLIYPYMPKDSTLTTFKTITTNHFNNQDYGTLMIGRYPMTASITTLIYTASSGYQDGRKYVNALVNAINSYAVYSPHFQYNSDYGNKETQELTFIDIPPIIYGSEIKKGSVTLDFFISGSSIGKLTDSKRNGELIQSSGLISANDDKVAGIVLYHHGIIILTGSWDLSTSHTEKYRYDAAATTAPRWQNFARSTNLTPSSSYQILFSGSQKTSVLTMMARAPAGQLNMSHNPTFTKPNPDATGTQNIIYPLTSSGQFYESTDRRIKNTVSSSFQCYDENFNRQTFITKVGIYDKEKNLIGIAHVARPVKKTEDRDLTFKLKLDI